MVCNGQLAYCLSPEAQHRTSDGLTSCRRYMQVLFGVTQHDNVAVQHATTATLQTFDGMKVISKKVTRQGK